MKSFNNFRHLAFASGSIVSIGAGLAYYRHLNIIESSKFNIRLRDLNPFPAGSGPLKEKSILVPTVVDNILEMLKVNWNTASGGQKCVWALIGVNSLVFIGWRIPAMQSFMNKHFVHHPFGNRPYTLLTCVFSHQQPMHFAFNMLALNSLYTFYQHSNQISTEQTLAFYLSAGYIC